MAIIPLQKKQVINFNTIQFMKRTLIMLAVATMILGMASCKKDNKDASSMRFTASLEGFAKTVLNGEILTWNGSENITVSNTVDNIVYRATYIATPQTNARVATFAYSDGELGESEETTYRAFYPANITEDGITVKLPAVQASQSGELTGYPMYTESPNERLAFKNLCSVLKITMQKQNTLISKIQIITDQYINGDFEIDNTGNAPSLVYHNSNRQNNHKKVTTLTFSNGPVNITNGHDFYIYLPALTYDYFQIKVYNQNGDFFTRTATSSLTFARSEYNYLTIPEAAINFKPGDLIGEFSVSYDSRTQTYQKVSFSKGNLLQNGSTYKFADLQYNKTESGYTNLFNWHDDEYSQTMNERGANAIINGGNTANMWRTLTQSEWHYLLSYDGGRPYDWLWALVQVNGIGGMIIFPDGFDWPLDESKKPANLNQTASTAWNGKNYSLDEWGTLEAAGCVFLPQTGYKEHSNSSLSETSSGYYWSSTPKYSSSNDKAKYTYFTPTSSTFPTNQNGWYLDHELAIRLVKNVPTQQQQ